jgi:hypothetical protein
MAKARRGRYVEQDLKLRVNSRATPIKGKSQPSLRLTLYLPKDVVRKIFPQIERLVKKYGK